MYAYMLRGYTYLCIYAALLILFVFASTSEGGLDDVLEKDFYIAVPLRMSPYIYLYRHAYTYIYIYTYIYLYICVYMSLYIYIFIYTFVYI